MAPNPYEKALSLLNRNAEMETSPPIDGVQSDSTWFDTNSTRLVVKQSW